MPRFGSFEVRGKLGTGGLADVFLGELAPEESVQGVPHQPVALKVLRDPDAARSAVRRFMREGRLLQRYAHPGLPDCYAVLPKPRPTLVLERLEGECLADTIRRGPLPIEGVLAVAEQVLRVLTWLHGKGVVHRDVKPGNLQIHEGHVILMDLGLAMDPREPLDLRRGEVLGTYAYMAPEQIAGAAVDHRADLYSLGLSLYEALSGTRPYKARGAMNWLMAHTQGRAPPLAREDCPAHLRDLVLRLMHRDPSSRPHTAALALATLTGQHDTDLELQGPPLTGRAAACGAIEGCLDEGASLLLIGQTGAGGARLVREAWTLVQGRGLQVAGARCDGRGGLHRLVERALGSSLKELDGPCVLILEDLHLANASTLTWLRSLMGEQKSELEVSVIGTSAWELSLGCHAVGLRDLDLEEVRTLVSGMLGGLPPPGFPEHLHGFTGGLPGAIVYTVRDYCSRGALTCEGTLEDGKPSWRLAGALRMSRRNRLQHIWGPRLEGLNADAARLLRLLSVALHPLPVRLCSEVAEITDPVVLYRLQRDELAVVEEDQIVVARPAVAALVASTLADEERRALHAALAEALAKEPSTAVQAEALTWHQAMGTPGESFARAMVDIAVNMEAEGRPTEARQVLLRVQHHAMDEPTAARAALTRARVLLALSRPEASSEAVDAAIRLASELEDWSLETEARAQQAHVELHRGRVREALECAEEVLVRKPMQATALVVKGSAQMLLGSGLDAAATFTEILDLQDPAASAAAHGGLGGIYAHAGRLGDGLRYVSQQVRFLRREGTHAQRVDALVQLGLLSLAAGDVDQARALLDEARTNAERSRLAHAIALAGTGRARFALALGDTRLTDTLLRRYADAARGDGSLLNRLQWLGCRVELMLELADDAAALAAANRVLELAQTVGWEGARAYYAGLVAVLCADGKGLEGALSDLEACGDRLRRGRLLVHAARLSHEPERTYAAMVCARQVGDLLLRISALHLSGVPVAGREARPLAFTLLQRSSGDLRDQLCSRPAVVWALRAR